MNELINLVDKKRNEYEAGDCYCSFTPTSVEGKKALYKAMSEADVKIGDYLNTPIDLKDVYVEMVERSIEDVDSATGEVYNRKYLVPRVVLFDRTGKSYGANSWGIMRSVERLLQVYGNPAEWGEPVTVMVVQRQLKGGKRAYALKTV